MLAFQEALAFRQLLTSLRAGRDSLGPQGYTTGITAIGTIIITARSSSSAVSDIHIGYPWYDPYYYPYGYYDYNRPAVYEGTAAYDDGLVVQVQHRLARAGFYHGSVDGVMGPETRHAIRAYERSHNLRVDGAIDDRLLDTMDIR